jgi:hypothetical protein
MPLHAKASFSRNPIQQIIEIAPFKAGDRTAPGTDQVVKMTRMARYIPLFADRPMNTGQPATGVKLFNGAINSCPARSFTVRTQIGVKLFGTERSTV